MKNYFLNSPDFLIILFTVSELLKCGTSFNVVKHYVSGIRVLQNQASLGLWWAHRTHLNPMYTRRDSQAA